MCVHVHIRVCMYAITRMCIVCCASDSRAFTKRKKIKLEEKLFCVDFCVETSLTRELNKQIDTLNK